VVLILFLIIKNINNLIKAIIQSAGK